MAPKDPVALLPVYIPGFSRATTLEWLRDTTAWAERVEARKEAFMSEGGGVSYTYGKGRGVREYTSSPYTSAVRAVLDEVNIYVGARWPEMNACFLNRYDDDHKALGWHSDDFPGMDHVAPVAVVSYGEPREIWWRKIGDTGEVSAGTRKLLEPGSLFIMPPGFQQEYQHRIPKGSRAMGCRISLTFRRFAC